MATKNLIASILAVFAVFFIASSGSALANSADLDVVEISDFEMELLDEATPTLSLSESDAGTVTETSLWSISGASGDEIGITIQGDPIMPWAGNSGMYHTADKDYMYHKVAEAMVATAKAKGHDWAPITKVYVEEASTGDRFLIEVNADGTCATGLTKVD